MNLRVLEQRLNKIQEESTTTTTNNKSEDTNAAKEDEEDEEEEAAELRGEEDRYTDERRVGAIVRDSRCNG